MWPNSGALEAGETARVQVLLLGTKVNLADPQRVEECRRDRFQVGCSFHLASGCMTMRRAGVSLSSSSNSSSSGWRGSAAMRMQMSE